MRTNSNNFFKIKLMFELHLKINYFKNEYRGLIYKIAFNQLKNISARWEFSRAVAQTIEKYKEKNEICKIGSNAAMLLV